MISVFRSHGSLMIRCPVVIDLHPSSNLIHLFTPSNKKCTYNERTVNAASVLEGDKIF